MPSRLQLSPQMGPVGSRSSFARAPGLRKGSVTCDAHLKPRAILFSGKAGDTICSGGATHVSSPYPPRLSRGARTLSKVSVVEAPAVEAGAVNLEDPGVEPSAEPFSWKKSWWPVLVVGHLDRQRPHPVTVLGQRYVVWWDAKATPPVAASDIGNNGGAKEGGEGEGVWRCFDDACPHRLAPLSEGRIDDDGKLQCSYHGWKFCGQGKCTSIPQASGRAAETACTSQRSATTSYPTQVTGGMLFVWPDASPDAEQESAAKYIPVPPFLQTYSKKNPTKFYSRHLPYSYEMLLENLVDPAHLPFSHHGIGALSRDKGSSVPMVDARKVERVKGSGGLTDPTHFSGAISDAMYPYPADMDQATFHLLFSEGSQVATNLTFFAPNHVRYSGPLVNGQWRGTFLYFTPTMPGKSLVFLSSFGTVAQPEMQIGFLNKLKAKLMTAVFATWVGHQFGAAIFDGDGVFLHYQGENMRLSGKTNKDYYLATSADSMVAKCNQWVHEMAGGGPAFPPGAPLSPMDLPRSALLDRFDSHTKHCTSCSAAMKNFQVMQVIAAAGVVSCLLACAATSGAMLLAVLQAHEAAVAVASSSVASATALSEASIVGLRTVAIASALLAVAFAALWEFCGRVIQNFVFVDYVHADRP